MRLDGLHLVTRYKTKQFDVFVQVFQGELNGLAGGQVVYAKAGKVADDDDLRQVTLGNAGKVRQRLRQRSVQIFAARLLFDQQHAGPEEVDKTVGSGVLAGQLFNRMLEGGDTFVGDAKDFKEIKPERLALAVFIGRVSPGAAERMRAGLDFVPGEGHRILLTKYGSSPYAICTRSYLKDSF